jgi:hypothetical protein
MDEEPTLQIFQGRFKLNARNAIRSNAESLLGTLGFFVTGVGVESAFTDA